MMGSSPVPQPGSSLQDRNLDSSLFAKAWPGPEQKTEQPSPQHEQVAATEPRCSPKPGILGERGLRAPRACTAIEASYIRLFIYQRMAKVLSAGPRMAGDKVFAQSCQQEPRQASARAHQGCFRQHHVDFLPHLSWSKHTPLLQAAAGSGSRLTCGDKW